MRQWFLFSFLFSFLVLPMHFVRADEQVGRFKIEEILLRPTYFSAEKMGGEFSFSDSQVSFEWSKDDNISAHIALGSTRERAVSILYDNTEPEETLGFIEAYAQYTGIYGFVRAGLVPLGFGSSGLEENHDRVWPKPILFSERIVSERDYGLSFLTENNGYFAQVTAHNGEVDQTDKDGDLWITTRWGWANGRKFQAQISGQAGRTSPESTLLGEDSLTGWDHTKSASWRFAALSVAWRPRNWEVQLQTVVGEREQSEKTASMAIYQLDFIRYLGKNWGFGLRHDQFDPNSKLSNDQRIQDSAMLLRQSDDGTSLLSVVYTKRAEEKGQIPNDQGWIQWRVTPFVK